MASARFKPIALAFVGSLSLALMGETAPGETKQREQAIGQAQEAAPPSSDLTAEKFQALQRDAEALLIQKNYSKAADLQKQILDWHEINSGPAHPDTATSV